MRDQFNDIGRLDDRQTRKSLKREEKRERERDDGVVGWTIVRLLLQACAHERVIFCEELELRRGEESSVMQGGLVGIAERE